MSREQTKLALLRVSFYLVLRPIMGGSLCDLISDNFLIGFHKGF